MEMFAEEWDSTRTMAQHSSAPVEVNDPNEASDADVDIVRVDVGGAADGAKDAAKRAADVPITAGNLSVMFEREKLNKEMQEGASSVQEGWLFKEEEMEEEKQAKEGWLFKEGDHAVPLPRPPPRGPPRHVGRYSEDTKRSMERSMESSMERHNREDRPPGPSAEKIARLEDLRRRRDELIRTQHQEAQRQRHSAGDGRDGRDQMQRVRHVERYSEDIESSMERSMERHNREDRPPGPSAEKIARLEDLRRRRDELIRTQHQKVQRQRHSAGDGRDEVQRAAERSLQRQKRVEALRRKRAMLVAKQQEQHQHLPQQHQHLPQQQRLTPELERSRTHSAHSANRQARLEGLAREKQALEQALQDVSAHQEFQTWRQPRRGSSPEVWQ
jgi:hypothetical protein